MGGNHTRRLQSVASDEPTGQMNLPGACNLLRSMGGNPTDYAHTPDEPTRCSYRTDHRRRGFWQIAIIAPFAKRWRQLMAASSGI